MAWFRKEKKPRQPRRERLEIPADVWEKCEACGHTDIREKFVRNFNVCPNCDYHRRIRAIDYAQHAARRRHVEEIERRHPLHRSARLPGVSGAPQEGAHERRRHRRHPRPRRARWTSCRSNLGIMDFAFMGGSMGSVVGEKIARLGQRSLERKHPLIIVSASGGARMQEGVLSLMQMAKVARRARRSSPSAASRTSRSSRIPTTGGVSASYAMLGDAILAEPGAVIGFAGPRVIKQTLGQDLPEGFQTAEFLLDHGMLDAVVHRRDLKRTVGQPAAPHERQAGRATGWATGA